MNRLFDIGSELSTANIQKAHDMRVSRMGEGVGQADVSELEKLIDGSEAKLEPLKNFILPIGCEAACRFHLARSAVRQAEVAVIEYVEELPSPQTAKSTEHSDVQPNDQGLRPEIIAYLNRLSDLLFSWSRLCNAEAQIAEEPWVKS